MLKLRFFIIFIFFRFFNNKHKNKFAFSLASQKQSILDTKKLLTKLKIHKLVGTNSACLLFMFAENKKCNCKPHKIAIEIANYYDNYF